MRDRQDPGEAPCQRRIEGPGAQVLRWVHGPEAVPQRREARAHQGAAPHDFEPLVLHARLSPRQLVEQYELLVPGAERAGDVFETTVRQRRGRGEAQDIFEEGLRGVVGMEPQP